MIAVNLLTQSEASYRSRFRAESDQERIGRRRRHLGNHRYVWALTPGARRDLAREPHLAYPKFNARSCRVDRGRA